MATSTLDLFTPTINDLLSSVATQGLNLNFIVDEQRNTNLGPALIVRITSTDENGRQHGLEQKFQGGELSQGIGYFANKVERSLRVYLRSTRNSKGPKE